MDAGRYGEAISLLDQYLSQRPAEADAYRMRGVCYEGRGQWDLAVVDFRKALTLEPGNQQVEDLLGRAERTLRGRISQKIDGYKRDLARNPNAQGPYLLIAQAYRTLQDWGEAEQWYEGYFKRTDGNPDEALQYCEVLAKLNHLQKGELFLQQELEKHPQEARLESRHGYFLLWLGKYAAARTAFEKARGLDASLLEAQDGLDQVSAAERTARTSTSALRSTPPVETPIERSTRALRSNPRNDEARFSLVQQLTWVNRFEEALHNLDTLALDRADSLRIQDARFLVMARRDSLYRSDISDYLEALKDDGKNTELLRRVADRYAELGEYQSALDYLERILAGVPDSSDLDVRYQYARYAAWGRYFSRALPQVTILLRFAPGNLDYQLLRGQISIWSLQDVDTGVPYLNNVVRLSPTNIPALTALSSGLAIQRNFTAARDYLQRAKRIDPNSSDVIAAQRFYDEAVRAEAEKSNYAILEAARASTSAGDCARAARKYEEYMTKVPEPGKIVLLEYADVQSCAKNQDKAIQICDQILQEGYDFDVALARAKYILWSGDSLRAEQEFRKLTDERPENFPASLYLGESYQRLGRNNDARLVYQHLLDRPLKDEERTEVVSRMKYLPLTGLSAAFTTFPTRLAFSPPVSYYTDNQEFSLASVGGRVELGVASMLSLGGSYGRVLLQSPSSTRYFNNYKGQLYIKLSDRLSVSGGFGTLQSGGRDKRTIGDATVVYERPGTVHIEGYFEANDAAMLLYSPYLIELPYDARLYKVLGSYATPSGWELSGSYKTLAISDGNKGSELQTRLGHRLFNDLSAGYEYMYSDFIHQAAWIPFTDHARQLYYTPQNIESHAAWFEWQPQNDQDVVFTLRGRIGYLPTYRTALRDISGELNYRATTQLLLNGKFSLGNTYRSDGGYNYASLTFSIYWSVL